MKTEGMEDGGGCLIKVQRTRPLVYMGFLAADLERIAASTKEFVDCAPKATIPQEAKWILYGFTHRGPGKIWMRGASLRPK